MAKRPSKRERRARRKYPSPDDERQRQAVAASAPTIRVDVDAAIAECLELLRTYNPLPLLARLTMSAAMIVEGEERDGSLLEAQADYALGLALAVENPGPTWPPAEAYERFRELIERIAVGATMFHVIAMQPRTPAERGPQLLRALSVTKLITARGPSVHLHETELLHRLFGPLDDVFERAQGFTATAALEFIAEITRTVDARLNGEIEALRRVRQLREERDPEEVKTDPIVAKWIEARDEELYEFRIRPTDPREEAMLAAISSPFGSNKELLVDTRSSSGWPTNESPALEKPIVRTSDGRYYCINPLVLMRNRERILERILRDRDRRVFDRRYADHRGRTLEDLCAEHLQRLLPDAAVHRNLKYAYVRSDGVRVDGETDLLVIHDDRMIIGEMKAGRVTAAAQRGAPERLRRTAEDLIGNASAQAARTLQYLDEVDRAKFRAADGSEVVIDQSKWRRRGTYVLVGTMAEIGHLSGQLANLRAQLVIAERVWPWVVFVNDLRVVSEIVESPADLFLFLERRAALNDLEVFASVDELDFFGLYLRQGLYFTREDVRDVAVANVVGNSRALDDWYNAEVSGRSAAPRPRLSCGDDRRRLVDAIQAHHGEGRTAIAMTLLSLSGEEFSRWHAQVRELTRMSAADGRAHRLTVLFDRTIVCGDDGPVHLAVSVVASDGHASADKREFASYLQMKRHQLRAPRFCALLLNGSDLAVEDVRVFDDQFSDDPRIAQALERRALALLTEYRGTNARFPGRNDSCPCNSGEKYKRCCIRLESIASAEATR